MREIYENSAEYREVPQMTRSEYIEEYTEITTYFDKEKKTLKKLLPMATIIAAICVAIIVFLMLSGTNVLNYSWRVHIYFGQETAIFYFLIPLMPTFPFVALLVRFKKIKDKENERLKHLEDRKKLCIELGTYNAEE